jgi:hypothetical protein
MQIQSGGLLRATPHCVRGPSTRAALRTSRNTLAVFMQPDPTSKLLAPPGAAAADVGVEGFQPGMTFGGLLMGSLGLAGAQLVHSCLAAAPLACSPGGRRRAAPGPPALPARLPYPRPPALPPAGEFTKMRSARYYRAAASPCKQQAASPARAAQQHHGVQSPARCVAAV